MVMTIRTSCHLWAAYCGLACVALNAYLFKGSARPPILYLCSATIFFEGFFFLIKPWIEEVPNKPATNPAYASYAWEIVATGTGFWLVAWGIYQYHRLISMQECIICFSILLLLAAVFFIGAIVGQLDPAMGVFALSLSLSLVAITVVSIRMAVKNPQVWTFVVCFASIGNLAAHLACYGVGDKEAGFLATRILHMVSFTGFFGALIALAKQGHFAAPAKGSILEETDGDGEAQAK